MGKIALSFWHFTGLHNIKQNGIQHNDTLAWIPMQLKLKNVLTWQICHIGKETRQILLYRPHIDDSSNQGTML